jgi:hypothetical protein
VGVFFRYFFAFQALADDEKTGILPHACIVSGGAMRQLLFVCCSLLVICCLSHPLVAQDGGYSYARASNGIISVAVETTTGQFRIETTQGMPLLFAAKGGLTAYTNVRYGEKVYSTNGWNRPALPEGATALPVHSLEELQDRVRLRSMLHHVSDSVSLQLDFIPSLDGDFAYVDVVATFNNHGAKPAPIGLMHLFDVMLSRDDNAECEADGKLIQRETAWRHDAVPSLLEASAPSSPYRVRLRLAAPSASKPDFLVAGNWQHRGYLGTVVWEYDPSGLPLSDLAVLLRWDEYVIQPGTQHRIGAEYGFLVRTDIELTCRTDGIQASADSSSYIPQPLPVHAVVRNTGVAPLHNIRLDISSAAPLLLAAGETFEKTIPGPLLPGADVLVTWLFDVDAVDVWTRAPVHIRILSPDSLSRDCMLDVDVPPLRPASLALLCSDTVQLAISPNGGGYAPDPFALRVLLTNTGKRPLRNLTAEVILPPQLVLVGATSVAQVLPDPLLPGQMTSVIWPLRGMVQSMDMEALCVVRVTGEGETLAECPTVVRLPAIDLTPCTETRLSTAGTEFYLAFLPDNIGVAAELLRVFITAPEGADVEVETLDDRNVTRLRIMPAAMEMLELHPRLNDFPHETVRRQGVRIRSDRNVHVFAGNFRDRHSDGTAVLPVHALGKHYYTVGYNWEGAWEHFLVLATEDATTVTITPRAITSTGRPERQPITIQLDEGELYCIKSRFAGDGGSLTGSRIIADRPVAVFSGGESGWIPSVATPIFGFLNPHNEQMTPVDFLGTEYAAIPFRSRLRGDTYKVVATQDNTTFDTPIGSFLLREAGDWREFILDSPGLISSDKPILIGQFANSARWDSDDGHYGDGSLLLLVPLDRHVACHYFPAGMMLADPVLEANQALFLDVDATATVPDNATTAIADATVECWVNSLNAGRIVSRWDDTVGGLGWLLRFDATRNRLVLSLSDGVQRRDIPSADNSVFRRQWLHLAVVHDLYADEVIVLKDGVELLRTARSPFAQASAPLRFGGRVDAEAWTGYLDECRLWSVPHGAGDIASRMGRRLQPLDMTGLIGYWGFCDEWKDESGFGNDMQPSWGASLFDAWDLPAELRCSPRSDSNFVSIVVPADAVSAVRLNHSQLEPGEWRDLPGGQGWSIASVLLPTGLNRLETSDPRGLGASSYGFAYHDAYTAFTAFGAWMNVASTVDAGAVDDVILHACRPNPASRGSVVYGAFTLPAAGRSQLRLYDMSGRMLRLFLDADCFEGVTTLRIPTEGLAAGVYRIELRYGQKNLFRTFVLQP